MARSSPDSKVERSPLRQKKTTPSSKRSRRIQRTCQGSLIPLQQVRMIRSRAPTPRSSAQHRLPNSAVERRMRAGRPTKGGRKTTDGFVDAWRVVEQRERTVTVTLEANGYRSSLLGRRCCAAEQKSATFVSDVGSMDDQGCGAK